MHLVWEDIENDLNRIVDFLINLLDSFEIFFSKFYECFGHGCNNLLWRQLIWFMILN